MVRQLFIDKSEDWMLNGTGIIGWYFFVQWNYEIAYSVGNDVLGSIG
jgi:hypothetical protein